MNTSIRTVAVIPARFGSTRFPGKPLALIGGKPMILWTLEQVMRAKAVSGVIVATDHQLIADTVRNAGGQVVMTSSDLASGTDRVAFVSESIEADIIANVQGDEPLIDPIHIDLAISALIQDSDASVSTLAAPLLQESDLFDENIVKILIDEQRRAVYFSRTPIPFPGQLTPRIPGDVSSYLRHIGLYIYRKSFLLRFSRHAQSFSERIERLEQLRALDMGARIAVRCVDSVAPSIDTPEDLNKVETLLRRR